MRALPSALFLIGVLAVAGCGPSTDDVQGRSADSPSASATVAKDVPTGIDPCNIPPDVLNAVTPGLRKGTTDDNTSRGEIKWRGCRYIVADGYANTVSLTNLTLDMLREKNFPGREEVVDGRSTLITHQASDPTGVQACTVNVEMRGGSLEFMVDNPSSRRVTGHLNACDIGVSLAQHVVPLIEAGA